jgi:predicted amidophosphoribosyltransferase
MVLDFKFNRAPIDDTLGSLLVATVQGSGWAGNVDALVPVAMHWWRRLQRKHHPTRVLAKAAAPALDLPVVEVLCRTQYRPPQVGLSAPQRVENVRGSFGVVRGARLDGMTLCLIDDVTTTGATLLEAARILKKAGAAAVYAAVLTKSESTRSN